MNNLSNAKTFGGIGALLLLIGGFIPYAGPLISIVGLVLVFIAVKSISDITKEGLPENEYDLITTFDVIHDMAQPYYALEIIRKSLKHDGTYLLLEINTKDKLEDNIGPFGTLFYGWSIMYCMTVSLGAGGEGLGTAGLPESKVKEYCTLAGFKYVRKIDLDNPFNSLYEIKKNY